MEANFFQVILVGPSEAGKTNLLARYIGAPLPEQYSPTTGVTFEQHRIHQAEKRIKIRIGDFAGGERFRILQFKFGGGPQAVIGAFDVTSRTSFADLRPWLDDMKKDERYNVPLFLVACKCDDLSSRAVALESAQELASEYGASYFETSALRSEGVEQLFHAVISVIVAKRTDHSLIQG